MEGRTWWKLYEGGGTWRHTVGRQLTGNAYAKEVQKYKQNTVP